VIAPLHKISRKGCRFIWSQDHETAFQEVKRTLMSEQVLTLPQKEGLFRLHVDSSKKGVGVMLTQEQNGKERVLSFYSNIFADAASRYSISELELFGIKIAVKAFRHMLRGHHFQIVSDHSSLVQIVKSKNIIPTTRMCKILENLLDYHFDLVYKKGSEHVIPDFLSRCPMTPIDDEEPIFFSLLQNSPASQEQYKYTKPKPFSIVTIDLLDNMEKSLSKADCPQTPRAIHKCQNTKGNHLRQVI
jgi:hypothetical protein